MPIVAIIGLLIAYRQWRTAKDKLKHDLFDRRFSVFEATRNLFTSIMMSKDSKGNELAILSYKASEAKWLFNQEISKYLTMLSEKAFELDFLNHQLSDLYAKYPGSEYISVQIKKIPAPVHEQIETKRRMQSELISWFDQQFSVVDEKLSPFFTLKH